METTNQDLLYSIVLLLTPTREVAIRKTVGHQAQAAFLRKVEESDPALAEVLHLPNLPVRPFTVSPLQGVSPARDGWAALSPGEDYWLRFTVLYPPLFEIYELRVRQPGGRLGEASWSIAFNQDAFFVDSLAWWKEQREDSAILL